MKELLLIAIGSAIVNNVVLSQFLGICPFLGVSKKTETAAGMGGAVVFVITISSFVTALIYKFILANSYLMSKGIDLTYLQTIVFILKGIEIISTVSWSLDRIDMQGTKHIAVLKCIIADFLQIIVDIQLFQSTVPECPLFNFMNPR